jgi:hypothetical protein
LRIGNAKAVADRLALVLSQYPSAGPLVALQMRTLFALGRVPEALQCFADTRRMLAQELGVEPGAALQAIHLAVLRGTLDGGESSSNHLQLLRTSVQLVPTPRQLTPDVGHFVGREEEMSRISNWCSSPEECLAAPVVSIYGAPGVGNRRWPSTSPTAWRIATPTGRCTSIWRG